MKSDAERIAGQPGALFVVACVTVATFASFSPWGVIRITDAPTVLASIAALVAIAPIALSSNHSPRRIALGAWRLTWAAGFVVAIWLVSALLSPYRWSGLLGAPASSLGVIQVTTLLALLLGAAFMSQRELRPLVGKAAVVLLAVQAGFVAFQVAAGRHPQGTLSNSTYMAQVVLLALPIVVSLAEKNVRIPRWVAWAVPAAAIVALGALEARTAFLAGAGWLVWRAVRYATASGNRKAARKKIAVVSAICAAALIVGLLVVYSGGSADSLFGTTDELWVAASRVVADRPALGSGPDSFRMASAEVIEPEYMAASAYWRYGAEQLSADPHNAVLGVLVAAGLAGLAAVVWLSYEVVRNWRAQSRAGRLQEAYVASVVLYAVTVMTAPAPAQTLPLAVVVLGASLVPEAGKESVHHARTGRLIASIGLVAAILSTAHAATYLAAGKESSDETGPGALRTERLANAWHDPYLHYSASRRWAWAARNGAAQPSEGLESARRAQEIEPENPFYAAEYAMTLASTGVSETEVREALDRALELYPDSPEVHEAYILYLVDVGDLDGAEAHAEALLRLMPDFGRSHTLAANVYDALGEQERAAEHRRYSEEARK